MDPFRVEKFFTHTLMHWDQDLNHRSMPWKKEADPYRIWLSEIILQQTQVKQGEPYYLRFIQTYPDIRTLAAARDEEVFRLWQGLGYYTRCRNMLAAARKMVNEYKGQFPRTYEQILELPGVGPYTAAAISSFAFGLPHAVVDGNVIRVLSRFFGIRFPADTTEGKAHLTAQARVLLDKAQPGAYNQAIMDFGAQICRPQLPNCPGCPLSTRCVAYREGLVELLPLKSRKPVIRERHFNWLIILRKKKIYLHRREEKDIWQNLYEFPLIETTKTVTAKKLIESAEFKHIFNGVRFQVLGHSGILKQQLTHRKILARFIFIEVDQPPATLKDNMLVDLKDLGAYAFPGIIISYFKEKNLTLSGG